MTIKPLTACACLFIACLFIISLLAIASIAHAADVGFRVSPTSINMTIAVGDETEEHITLQNSSTDEIVVKAHVSADGNEAGPYANTRPDANTVPVVSLEPAEVTLKPGASAQVAIHIQVPDDAEPGHQLSFVLFDAAPAGAKDVSIVGQVGVAIGTEVIRPVSDVTWWFPRVVDSADRVIFQAEGRNTGNFTTRLEGTAVVSGLSGGESSLLVVSDPVEVGESAHLQVVWDDVPRFSIKKVTLGLSSGVGAPVERQVWLLIFPWKLSLMLGSILAIAVAGVRFRLPLAKVFSRNWRRGD